MIQNEKITAKMYQLQGNPNEIWLYKRNRLLEYENEDLGYQTKGDLYIYDKSFSLKKIVHDFASHTETQQKCDTLIKEIYDQISHHTEKIQYLVTFLEKLHPGDS